MRKILLAAAFWMAVVACVPAQGGEKTVLRFSWWGGNDRHEATLAAIKAFEAHNPDIEVKAEYMGWDGYLERLTTQIGAGSEADVMQIDWAWIAMFSKTGDGFYDLNRQKNVVNLGEFDQQWLDTGTVKGKLNAFFVSFTAQVELWNKTTWDKAGVPLPKTWDDLLAAGKAFQEKLGPDYYPLDLDWHEIVLMTHSYIFQKTGKQYLWPDKPEVALTRDELADWMRLYKSLVDAKSLTNLSTRASIGGGDTQRGVHEFVEFIDGKWAGTMTWDAYLSVRMSTVKKGTEYVVGDFLTLPDAKASGRIGRPSMLFAIGKNCKNPEAAAKLINFLLCTEEAAKILKSTRGVFISKIGYKTTLDAGLIAPLNKVAMEQVRASQCFTPNPYFEHARVKDLLRQAVEGVGFGKLSPEQAADMLLEEGNKIVARLAR